MKNQKCFTTMAGELCLENRVVNHNILFSFRVSTVLYNYQNSR